MQLSQYSKKYIHYYAGELPALIQNIFENYNIKNVADLGSGDGSILYALFNKGFLNNINKAVAVDISPERIENVRKISEKILAVAADACQVKMLDSGTFDLVICSQVIEHVAEEEKLIKEAHRILNERGLFYISTVFKKRYAWFFYRCNNKWVLDPTHLREYTCAGQLLDIIRKFDFKLLDSRKTLFWFPISDFIFKRIGMARNIYDNKIAGLFRKIKVPILGYYCWELVLKKEAK